MVGYRRCIFPLDDLFDFDLFGIAGQPGFSSDGLFYIFNSKDDPFDFFFSGHFSQTGQNLVSVKGDYGSRHTRCRF